MESIRDHADRFGFTMCDAASDEIITDQKGVFRTNCLDWSVWVYPCAVLYVEQRIKKKTVSTVPILYKTFCLGWAWNNTCFSYGANGYSQPRFGIIIANYGPKMAMLFREYTRGQAHSILALRGPGRGHWPVWMNKSASLQRAHHVFRRALWCNEECLTRLHQQFSGQRKASGDWHVLGTYAGRFGNSLFCIWH